MKLGLVQAPAGRDPLANLQTLTDFAAQAAREGCQVVCFPECFLTGYAPESARELALAPDSPLLARVVEAAAALGIDILAGFMERSGDMFYITQGLFRRDGTRDHYRKTHLGLREGTVFAPGQELKVLSLTGGTKIGIALCVETHYPEITQTLALRGAGVIFAPHAVPRKAGPREAVWRKYIPARSYDSRVFLACCNLWDGESFGGGCLVTDPRGGTAAACFREEAALLTCRVDPRESEAYRDPENPCSRHYFPARRRRELYD